MMLGEPRAVQLIEAVAGYVESIAPSLSGRDAFHGRVAVNALRIVVRELELGPAAEARELQGLAALGFPGQLEEARRALCAAIRSGEQSLGNKRLADHLLRCVANRVAIEQPNYASLARIC